VDSGEACYVPLEIILAETNTNAETRINLISPCLLPPLHTIRSIKVTTPRYWEQEAVLPNDSEILCGKRVMHVKRKAGFLPYREDPQGYRSILSRSFPKQSIGVKNQYLLSFEAQPNGFLSFAKHFCTDTVITAMLYECLTHQKQEMLSIYLSLYLSVKNIGQTNALTLTNLKLLFSFSTKRKSYQDTLIQSNFIHYLKAKVDCLFENLGFETQYLQHYLNNSLWPSFPTKQATISTTQQRILFGAFLNYYDIPVPILLSKIQELLAKQTITGRSLYSLLGLLVKNISYDSSNIPILFSWIGIGNQLPK
jgi:hypothetical protein